MKNKIDWEKGVYKEWLDKVNKQGAKHRAEARKANRAKYGRILCPSGEW
jgi:hypothetical protein